MTNDFMDGFPVNFDEFPPPPPAEETSPETPEAIAARKLRSAWRATDWSSRVRVPAFLRAAGLVASADAVAGLPEQVDVATVLAARAVAADAARTAYAEWCDVKPEAGTPVCLDARTRALDATTETERACAMAAIPAAAQMMAHPDRATVIVVFGDLENAARFSAAVVALRTGALPKLVAEILGSTPWKW